MNRDELISRIERVGIMPSVRVTTAELALYAAETVYDAGIPVVEITMTVPGAVAVIGQLAQNYPDFIVGAGTVLDADTAQRCVDAGARFITSPGLVPEVLEFSIKNKVVAIPGSLTPSEVRSSNSSTSTCPPRLAGTSISALSRCPCRRYVSLHPAASIRLPQLTSSSPAHRPWVLDQS